MPTSILFCDATGTVVRVHDDGRSWPLAIGRPLAQVLGLDEQDMASLIHGLSPEAVHILPNPNGERLSVRLAPLPDTLAPSGGFVACLTLAPNLGILEKTEGPVRSAPTAASMDYAIFNAVFNDARDAIILADDALRVQAANRKAHRIYALDADYLLTDRDVLSIVHPRDQDRVLVAARSLKRGASWRAPLDTVDREGLLAPVKLNVRCLSVGGVRLYQFMLRDLRGRMALERDLEKSRQAVAGMNIALKQVLLTAEEEKQELKDDLVQQVREELLPTVDRMAREESPLVREAFKSALEERIADLSDAQTESPPLLALLSPREMDICRLIQQGWQGRAMAEELGISFETLQTHRKNIRRKLGLKGESVSLPVFLQQQSPL